MKNPALRGSGTRTISILEVVLNRRSGQINHGHRRWRDRGKARTCTGPTEWRTPGPALVGGAVAVVGHVGAPFLAAVSRHRRSDERGTTRHKECEEEAHGGVKNPTQASALYQVRDH